MNEPPDSANDTGQTCWTLIRSAANGSAFAINQFAMRYEPILRKSLRHRWTNSKCSRYIDDAIQEIFIECIRPGGVLEKAKSEYPGGFRAFLYGVTRNVMLRIESRPDWQSIQEQDPAVDESSLGKVFDREFARAVMKEASLLQFQTAELQGSAALRRVELLRARFHDDLPIREIAKLWGVEPAWLHHQYAIARAEFRDALLNVIRAQQPLATKTENEQTCRDLLGLL